MGFSIHSLPLQSSRRHRLPLTPPLVRRFRPGPFLSPSVPPPPLPSPFPCMADLLYPPPSLCLPSATAGLIPNSARSSVRKEEEGREEGMGFSRFLSLKLPSPPPPLSSPLLRMDSLLLRCSNVTSLLVHTQRGGGRGRGGWVENAAKLVC